MTLSPDNPFEQLARYWERYPPRGHEGGLRALRILQEMIAGDTQKRIEILNNLGSPGSGAEANGGIGDACKMPDYGVARKQAAAEEEKLGTGLK